MGYKGKQLKNMKNQVFHMKKSIPQKIIPKIVTMTVQRKEIKKQN